ncbi:hypothetical protein FZD47_25315 [Bacillus infantis]|uniref:Phage tail protein n=1 Tax=Bacillus infantis TaxID=324767 RepID=A0A5D4RXS7_9BACI|nr:hypothetical protein [Bacillus infantis]TYS55750.1 hypothetical protein FZD47_25315 [Bacillus infantis]
MPILRNGVTADQYQTPDIYFEEQEIPSGDGSGAKKPKVMAIIGQFEKGPVSELLSVTRKTYPKLAGSFTNGYSGAKAAYTAFKRGVDRLILVNVRGAGAAPASITLKNNADPAVDGLKIKYKQALAYGNLCWATVEAGRDEGTFRIILEGPNTEMEVYDNLKTFAQAAEAINVNVASEFEAENLYSGDETNAVPALPDEVIRFEGGADGSQPTAVHYKGTVDNSTGRKTGAELLKTSIEATDIVYDRFVSDIANDDLLATALKMNGYAYIGPAPYTSATAAITLRAGYDTEYGHLSLGQAKSKSTGFVVPAAVYDCIAHVLSLTQDGTAGFWFDDIESMDVSLTDEDIEKLTKYNVVSMGQMINENDQLVYGMKSDYTLSKKETERQTYRRRVTSQIEREYYVVLTPYRSKHMSPTWEKDVELVTRDYFNRKMEEELIENYSVVFAPPGTASGIDEYVQDLRVELYNVADKMRIRLLSAPNVIEGGNN